MVYGVWVFEDTGDSDGNHSRIDSLWATQELAERYIQKTVGAEWKPVSGPDGPMYMSSEKKYGWYKPNNWNGAEWWIKEMEVKQAL